MENVSGGKMMCIYRSLLLFGLCFLAPLHAEEGERFGVHTEEIKTEATDSVFTFRHGRLVHEITTFSRISPDHNPSWVERFYDGKNVLFTRAGLIKDGEVILSAEKYASLSQMPVIQGTRIASNYPERLYVGGESFDMGGDGFYKIIADTNSLRKESVIMAPEFSTKELENVRRKYLREE